MPYGSGFLLWSHFVIFNRVFEKKPISAALQDVNVSNKIGFRFHSSNVNAAVQDHILIDDE